MLLSIELLPYRLLAEDLCYRAGFSLFQVRENRLEKLHKPPNTFSQKELIKLEEERQNLEKRVEVRVCH